MKRSLLVCDPCDAAGQLSLAVERLSVRGRVQGTKLDLDLCGEHWESIAVPLQQVRNGRAKTAAKTAAKTGAKTAGKTPPAKKLTRRRCPDCGKMFDPRGLGRHLTAIHG